VGELLQFLNVAADQTSREETANLIETLAYNQQTLQDEINALESQAMTNITLTYVLVLACALLLVWNIGQCLDAWGREKRLQKLEKILDKHQKTEQDTNAA